MTLLIHALFVILLPAAAFADAQTITPVRATLVAQGFDRPVAFVQDPSDPSRQVVVEQGGRIRLLVNGVVQATDYLNLSGAITPGGPDERGLLGFAFAPDYATSGRVYASFTNVSGHSVVARFTRSTINPLTADPTTRFDLIWPGALPYIVQPYTNHNGGNMAFGPDGYLYIGMGDGGSGSDPQHYAQNPQSLLGKMLRIDVAVSGADAEGYDVPPGNPFVGQAGVHAEIWSFGLRNPWRWSFDTPALGGTGALVIGDVGQVSWEEIDYEPAGAGGRNYGWRNREGAHDHVTTLPPFSTPLTDPIHEYGRTAGRSVTGGYVYRGRGLGPGFAGRYIFGDFATGRVWSLGLSVHPVSGEATVTGVVDHTSTLGVAGQWSSFGVDAAGEVYLVAYGGQIYRLDPDTPAGVNFVQNGSFSGGSDGWLQFATPDPSYIVSNTTAGVQQFYRNAPPPGSTNQAVVFQETGVPLVAGAPILAAFDLGNSDSVRKRISVLVHDQNFSDLFVCTFWLPPNAPLATYGMRTHTTKAWGNATISFYAASANPAGNTTGFYRIDDVSVQYVPAQSATRTDCLDPNTPAPAGGGAGANLLVNGDFGTGTLPPWGLFGTIAHQIAGGVFEFVRPTSAPPAGVVLQATGESMTANQLLTATFQLGNSSAVRKRVTAILHDNDFSDLSACTFWLAPNQPLSTYTYRTYATQPWANATLSVYPATAGADQWIRLDDAVLQRTPSTTITGTECLEPSGSPDQRPRGPGWIRPVPGADADADGGSVASDDTASLADETAADAAATADDEDAIDGWIGDGFTREGDSAVPTWRAVAGDLVTHTLTHIAPIDLTTATEATVSFRSWLSAVAARARVEVSLNGVTWETAQLVGASDTWMPVDVDLRAYLGSVVFVRLAVEGGPPPAEGASPDTWRVDELQVDVTAAPLAARSPAPAARPEPAPALVFSPTTTGVTRRRRRLA